MAVLERAAHYLGTMRPSTFRLNAPILLVANPLPAFRIPLCRSEIRFPTAALEEAVGYRPATPVREGVRRFADWYRAHYGSLTT